VQAVSNRYSSLPICLHADIVCNTVQSPNLSTTALQCGMLCNPRFSLQKGHPHILPVLATASRKSTETISLCTCTSRTSYTTVGYVGWDSTEHRGQKLEQRP
jgi:hypothetical protein